MAVAKAMTSSTATALSLSTAARGYVRTQTLRAFTAAEMSKVLGKMV